jgi:uncharacterized protein involved in cysteine biosynthesis
LALGPARRKSAAMISAFLRALTVLSVPSMRQLVAICIGVAVASFAALWLGMALLIGHHHWFGWHWLDWLADAFGVVAVAILSWLLFPAIVTLIMGFFLERVAATVEALEYPGRGAPRVQPLGETIRGTLRLMGLTILLNILALPVYLLMPGINLFVFLALNGYLFGREYFEVVALRRLDTAATRAVRQRFAARLFIGGVMIAGLFAVPLVNLIAPVVATAFMVHVFERLRSFEAPALAS